jgi:hypothetical protein
LRDRQVKQKAQGFADELSNLLNKTVCRGVRLNSVRDPGRKVVWVGYRISESELTSAEAFELSTGKRSGIYCGLSIQLGLDDEGVYLMVQNSFMGLFPDSRMTKTLCHFDYERDKQDNYPEAHMQIEASSEAWEEVLKRSDSAGDRERTLAKLHLPVGGRRFRPTLEDIIEFVVSERLVEPHPGWKAVVEESRASFQEKQLRAAIRRSPDVARQAMRDLDLT